MESIGEKLRTQREQKGLSIEQVARDTNIAKRFLHALESEDFSAFPGETYLLGFLRNYTDYLGLDQEEMVNLFRNFKIQEQPIPMDELLVKKKPRIPITIIAGVVVVVGLIIGGYFLYPVIFSRDRQSRPEVETEKPSGEGQRYELTDEILERRFVEKDTVVIPFKEQEYEIVLSDIADNLTLTVPGGTNVLRIGDERAIDLDGDAKMDVKVFLTDIDASGEDPAVVLRFDRFVKTVTSPSNGTIEEISPEVEGVSSTATVIGSTTSASREERNVFITRANRPEPFSVAVVFRGYCLFRYFIDREIREERYFHKGETTTLDVGREVGLWISNAGNVTARVAGVQVEMGRPGEVTAKVIRWVEDDESSQSVLEMIPLY